MCIYISIMSIKYNHRIAMNRAYDTYIKSKHRLDFNNRDMFHFYSNPYTPIRQFSTFGMDYNKTVDDPMDYTTKTDDMELDEFDKIRSRENPYSTKGAEPVKRSKKNV
jgi:hypothetical protein